RSLLTSALSIYDAQCAVTFPYMTLFRSIQDQLGGLTMVQIHAGRARRRIDRDVRQAAVIQLRREGFGRRRLQYDGTVDIQSGHIDRKSTRLNSSHVSISYAVFFLQKKIR